jgi:hypothetical protein
MNTLHRVLEILGGATLVLGVLGAIAWMLVKHFFNQQLARYKVDLRTESEAALARLRSELSRATFEHETKFRRLDRSRVQVLARLYDGSGRFRSRLESRRNDRFAVTEAIADFVSA